MEFSAIFFYVIPITASRLISLQTLIFPAPTSKIMVPDKSTALKMKIPTDQSEADNQ